MTCINPISRNMTTVTDKTNGQSTLSQTSKHLPMIAVHRLVCECACVPSILISIPLHRAVTLDPNTGIWRRAALRDCVSSNSCSAPNAFTGLHRYSEATKRETRAPANLMHICVKVALGEWIEWRRVEIVTRTSIQSEYL